MRSIALLLALAFIVSCANSTKKEVALEVKAAEPLISRNTRFERAREAINQAEYLNDSQREQLWTLQDDLMAKIDEIKSEEGKLHAVLFSTMGDEKYNEAKLNRVVKELKKVHAKKLQVRMEAFAKFKNVMRGTQADASLYKNLWDFDSYSVTR